MKMSFFFTLTAIVLSISCSFAQQETRRDPLRDSYEYRFLNMAYGNSNAFAGCERSNDRQTITCADGVYKKTSSIYDIDRSIQNEPRNTNQRNAPGSSQQ